VGGVVVGAAGAKGVVGVEVVANAQTHSAVVSGYIWTQIGEKVG
jgi:hypothetical protein